MPGDWPAWLQRAGTVLWQTLAANRLWAAAAGGALLLLAAIVPAAVLAFSEPHYSLRTG